MPCITHEPDPDRYEAESKLVCQNLAYILAAQGKPVPSQVVSAASKLYGNTAILNEVTEALCNECKGLTEEQQNSIMYDGRNAEARRLAAWWEKHQEADRKREAKELAEKKRKVLVNNALAKLSKAEIEALRESRF